MTNRIPGYSYSLKKLDRFDNFQQLYHKQSYFYCNEPGVVHLRSHNREESLTTNRETDSIDKPSQDERVFFL